MKISPEQFEALAQFIKAAADWAYLPPNHPNRANAADNAYIAEMKFRDLVVDNSKVKS